MTIHHNAVAGLRAMLLSSKFPPKDGRITRETWRKWAPVIKDLLRHGTDAERSADVRSVLVDAIGHAPEEAPFAVRTIIRLERGDVRNPGANQIGRPYHILP